MIKMLVSARKKPGLTDQAYSAHWQTSHGDMVREHGHKMGFRRYIQTHLIDNEMPEVLSGTEGPDTYKNGQAELWWDSIDAMLATGATPEGQAASSLFEADEKRFCDVSNLSAFLADEFVLIDNEPAARYDCPPSGAKLCVELRRNDGAPAFAEWIERHRAFIVGPGAGLGAIRYIVNKPIDDGRFDFAKARGWKPAPDAHIEIWFADEDALRTAMLGIVSQAWKANVSRFADTGRFRPLVGRACCIFDHVAAGR